MKISSPQPSLPLQSSILSPLQGLSFSFGAALALHHFRYSLP